MKKGKLIALWVLTVFFALSAIVFFPSIFSFFAALVTVLILPIQKWQDVVTRFVKGKLKTMIVIALSLICVFTAPTTDVEPSETVDTGTAITSDFSTVEAKDSPSTETIIESATKEEKPDTISEPDTEVDNEEDIESGSETSAVTITEPTDEDISKVPTGATPETSDTVTEPVHTHDFSPATCTTPGVCSCGVTDGNANGHNWRDATCSAPQTCTECGETNGYATEHNYYNGTCTHCQAADPNYSSEPMVWIPTKGGKKYHSSSSCSGMDGPDYVTRSQAVARGFTPCKKCH